ncbi:transglycosylase domain-containing protein [Terrisporobacter sp.]|uniref:transglycosylase domain-containing protein n=1 Tax=Terrisporobacter sp. TaxID=1965305 RepID=UPI002634D9B0|nr:transglycosylase domain-containing protein [Terrisporobacter sp.]
MGRDNRDDRNKIKRRKVSSSDKNNTQQVSSNSNNSGSSKRKKTTSSKTKSTRFKGVKTLGVVFLVLLVVGVAVTSGIVFASLRDTVTVNKAYLEKGTYQTSEIYYSDGKLLAKPKTANKKEPVKTLSGIDKDLQNALVAAEDERFYEHNGVDIKGLTRSVVYTLLGKTQGGSTIPMQVSKMLITSQEKSITRKIKDIYYAYEMSKTVDKEDILLAYLNNFYVGRGLYGAEAGAKGYFSKSADDLTPGEAALLMAATNNPARYTPYTPNKLDGSETKEDLENKLIFAVNTTDDSWDEPTDVELQMVDKLYAWGLIPDKDTYNQLKGKTMIVRKAVPNEKAKEKQKSILAKMLRLGYITQEQYDEEVAKPIEVKLSVSTESKGSSVEDYIYTEVVDAFMEQGYTKEEASNLYYNGGLRIYTTIDSGMQQNLEKQYNDDNNFPNPISGQNGIVQPQSGMVILDYRTGQIKSLIGGRHIKTRGGINRATTPVQPGSTIKPLSVYTPAIDTLKTTQSNVFSDKRGGYRFNHNGWNPSTTTPGTSNMSVRKALAFSSNTIAVKTAETLGDTYDECIDIMINYLKDFGITSVVDSKTKEQSSTDRYFPSLTLGGMVKGISPLEMAAAYGTLANGGNYIEPTVYTTITTYDGQLLVKANPEQHKVVDEEVAYVITDMLQAVITEGTGKAASLGGMPVAGKTGTTNDSLDIWFVGYTPYYVGATYIADDAQKDDDGNNIKRRGQGSSSAAARLWAKVMGPIHQNLTKTKFTVPDGVYFTKINLDDGGTSSYGVSAAFVEGTYPSRASSYQAPSTQETEEEEDTENPNESGDGSNPPEDESQTPNEGENQTPPSDNNNNNNNNSGNNNSGEGGTNQPTDNIPPTNNTTPETQQ